MTLLSIVSDKNQHKNLERPLYLSFGIHALWNIWSSRNVTFSCPS